MKAVKGWMCGCTSQCAAVKTSRLVGDYDKPCFVVPAPLYRQMCGIVKAVTQMRCNGYSPRLHIKNVPGSFDLCSKLDKLEKLRRKQ